MRIKVTDATALRLGQSWDYFKRTIPVILIVGSLAFGLILMNTSIESEQAAFQRKCGELGGYLVKTVERRSIQLCIREIKPEEKIHVST